MINCKLEGEIVVRPVDDTKREKRRVIRLMTQRWELDGMCEILGIDGRRSCGDATVDAEGRADQEFDGRPCR